MVKDDKNFLMADGTSLFQKIREPGHFAIGHTLVLTSIRDRLSPTTQLIKIETLSRESSTWIYPIHSPWKDVFDRGKTKHATTLHGAWWVTLKSPD